MKPTLEQTLTDLINIQSFTGNDSGFEELKTWLETQLLTLPLIVETHVEGGSRSWLVTTRPTLQPKVLLCVHLDVVAGPDQAFTALTTKDKIIGRGAIDMKFAAACAIELLRELADEGAGKYDIGILFTTDEEMGGFHGAPVWLQKGLNPNIVLVPDGGANWRLERSAKGVLHCQIKASGTSAHASRVVDDDSAIDRLINFLSDIRKKYPHHPAATDLSQVTTCNIGFISGGEAANKVADYASAAVDIRVPATISTKDIWSELRTIAEAYPGILLSKTADSDSFATDVTQPLVKTFIKTVEQVRESPVTFTDSLGSSDARFFAEAGIPVAIMLPEGGNPHGDEEWVSRKGLAQYYQILREYIQEVAFIAPSKQVEPQVLDTKVAEELAPVE